MPGVIVSATTASFSSVEKRRLRATPLITSTFENVSDIGTCLGLSLGPPAIAGVRSKRGAVHSTKWFALVSVDRDGGRYRDCEPNDRVPSNGSRPTAPP